MWWSKRSSIDFIWSPNLLRDISITQPGNKWLFLLALSVERKSSGLFCELISMFSRCNFFEIYLLPQRRTLLITFIAFLWKFFCNERDYQTGGYIQQNWSQPWRVNKKPRKNCFKWVRTCDSRKKSNHVSESMMIKDSQRNIYPLDTTILFMFDQA